MQIKLTTFQQLDQLAEGDLIIRFPVQGAPEDVFDNLADKEIYQISRIDRNKHTLNLILSDEALEVFTWPRDIERLKMDLSKIISEKTWWIA